MKSYINIDAKELFNLITTQSLLLVDVRNSDEVARGIIEGAVHIPLALLPFQYESLTKVENIVFYCHSGMRSAHAAAFATSKDCQNVFNLVGGVLAWSRAGYKLVAINEEEKK